MSTLLSTEKRVVKVIAGISSYSISLEVGMVFYSLEDLGDLYRRYARDRGFTIIKASRNNDKEGNPQFVL